MAAVETLAALDAKIPAIAGFFGFFGVSYYRLARLGEPVTPSQVFGHDATQFIPVYLERNYIRVDPIISLTFRRDMPFTSREVEELFPEPSDLHSLRRELWARDGLFCPVASSCGEVGVVCWRSHDPVTLDAATRLQLKGLSSIMVAQAKAIAARDPDEIDIRPLSRREMECAYWLSQGKSANEIGEIIGISVHTVRQYLDSSVGKLGAKNRSDMVLRASALGLITEHR